MVNSPSRPISRPVAPPTPVECGGRTPLWHRETCLPVDRAARRIPPAIIPNHTTPVPFRISRFPLPCLPDLRNTRPETRDPRPETRLHPQSRQKPQQSRLIVPHQGNRHFFKPPPNWRIHSLDGSDRPANGQNVCQGEILSWGRGNR